MRPLIVANGEVRPEYVVAGLKVMTDGGSALDAVEHVARCVEGDPDDHTVGVGGLPNIAGSVELDAMIMDGNTLEVGAVAGIRRYPHPISIARAVMTRSPHVLLIGDGAERFAREHGFEQAPLLTEESRRRYLAKLDELGAAELADGADLPLTPLVTESMKTHRHGDTMNAIACDKSGAMAVAVSTSGLCWKHPGRVGDSPVPGAGAYADTRHGTAAATGLGELVLRGGTCLRAVLYRAAGIPPADATRQALAELLALTGSEGAHVRLILVTPTGTVHACATWPGAQVIHLHAGQQDPVLLTCQHVTAPPAP